MRKKEMLLVLAVGVVGTALAATPLVDADARWDAKRGCWNPNTDEAKVAPYTLEDPLAFESGRRIASVLDWPARRAEILDVFAKRMFGAEPPKPEKVTWDLVNEKVRCHRRLCDAARLPHVFHGRQVGSVC